MSHLVLWLLLGSVLPFSRPHRLEVAVVLLVVLPLLLLEQALALPASPSWVSPGGVPQAKGLKGTPCKLYTKLLSVRRSGSSLRSLLASQTLPLPNVRHSSLTFRATDHVAKHTREATDVYTMAVPGCAHVRVGQTGSPPIRADKANQCTA